MSEPPTRESRSSKAIAAPLLAPGQVVAGYQVSDLVGKGGMGEVYRARQLSMDREVALKVLNSRLAAKDPSFAQRFIDEARAAGKLNHPNIIHVHDVGTATLPDGRGVHFFSMEFIDGETVQDVLDREQRLERPRVAQIMEGTAAALAFAAKAGIVHRDIKPDNLMITKGGLVKLADLGLAIPSQTGENAPERDEKGRAKVMGTPLYLSPEQARALPVDHRADQYSLGATLFHMLTGEPPYRGADARSILKAHVLDPVRDPADVVPGVDQAWRQLAMRLMRKKPDERFATPAELVEAVEAAAKGVTLEQLARRKAGFTMPQWGWIALGAVALLLAFLLLLGHGARGGSASVPPAPPGPASQAPATSSASQAAELKPLAQALDDRRLKDAAGLLAALPGQDRPEVQALAQRLKDARAAARATLTARLAAAGTGDLPAVIAFAAEKPLPDDDQQWFDRALAARRAQLAAPTAPAPAPAPPKTTPAPAPAPTAQAPKPPATDADRWRELARAIDKHRAGLEYREIRPTIDGAVMAFQADDAKATLRVLHDIGQIAQNGEMALRAYISGTIPHVTVVINGKEVDVLLQRLSRNDVFYIVQKDGPPDPEQKIARAQVGMPWAMLLDEALKDQAVENAPQVRAACLWMWNLNEARAAWAALGDSALAKAVAELERRRK